MNFAKLGLSKPILRAVGDAGYTDTTAVQAQAIPHILNRRDVLGCAQTGTGKTAAFALPVIQHINESDPVGRKPRCLALAPTRELAGQILDSFETYGNHSGIDCVSIFGGVSQNGQVKALKKGVDVIIATPGRLLDLMQQGHVKLDCVDTLILDEADRMLDMGFIPDIRRIVKKVPGNRQTLMFSATMPSAIRRLADEMMTDPVSVMIDHDTVTPELVDQSVFFVRAELKPALLAHLVEDMGMERALVFTRTKRGADRLVKQLAGRSVEAVAIHGDKPQKLRQKALDGFRDAKVPLLVATDVVARGIDVDGITHVVNYNMSDEPETYVHRIGRTARAGASGSAVSFCDHSEIKQLEAIERLIGHKIELQPIPDLSQSNDTPHRDNRISYHVPKPAPRSDDTQESADTLTTATSTRRPHKRRKRRHSVSRKSRIR